MRKAIQRSWAGLIVLLLFSCQAESNKQVSTDFQRLYDSIKQADAPDKRTALFDLGVEEVNGKWELQGETDQVEALKVLLAKLAVQHEIENKVRLLPDSSTNAYAIAMVNNSVANLRSKGKHSAELATQAILGTPMKLLKIEGDFYLIQTPDAYLAWVDHGGVELMDYAAYERWLRSEKIIYTRTYGQAYLREDSALEPAGDLVLGSVLELIGQSSKHYHVRYPDGRLAYVLKEEAERLEAWSAALKPSAPLVELYARSLMGAPYLWGGTSSKGMDCSGFTKTVYLMNGLVIPRDASQQIHAGHVVDENLAFEGLKKGDLLFFGRKATDSTRQRVTHVGIWLDNGKQEFIHASGRVKIGSMDPEHPAYDDFNKNRYLGSRRYLGVEDPLIYPYFEKSLLIY